MPTPLLDRHTDTTAPGWLDAWAAGVVAKAPPLSDDQFNQIHAVMTSTAGKQAPAVRTRTDYGQAA